MSRKRRYVRPGDLQTPEDGMELEDRTAGHDHAKVAAARALRPDGLHWMSEWEAGRDAAIAATLAGQTVGELRPPADAGCRDCWLQGRDAVIEALAS